MKKSIFFFLALALSFVAYGQESQSKEIKLSSLTFSSGQGALSAGPLLEASFTRGDDVIGGYLGERDLCAWYLKSFWNGKIQAGPCVEYYHNVPLVDALVLEAPIKGLNGMTWIGFSAGTPDQKVELANWDFLFFWQSLSYTYKRFTVMGAGLYFGDWHPIVDFKYVQPLNKHFSAFTSAGYDFYGQGKSLLKMGLTYVP